MSNVPDVCEDKIMQSYCSNDLAEAIELFANPKISTSAQENALDLIMPLWQCHSNNSDLPCAKDCMTRFSTLNVR